MEKVGPELVQDPDVNINNIAIFCKLRENETGSGDG